MILYVLHWMGSNAPKIPSISSSSHVRLSTHSPAIGKASNTNNQVEMWYDFIIIIAFHLWWTQAIICIIVSNALFVVVFFFPSFFRFVCLYIAFLVVAVAVDVFLAVLNLHCSFELIILWSSLIKHLCSCMEHACVCTFIRFLKNCTHK